MTVLVTAFQQARWVEEALGSVAAQTLDDWHLVVTDDASTDGCAERIEAWVGHHRGPQAVEAVLHERNVGLNRTLNEVLPRCRGDYLAYLGADDRWAPEKLARLVAALEAEPAAAVAYSDARLIDADGAVIEASFLRAHGQHPGPRGDVFERLLGRNFVVASSAVYRRAAVEAVGGWDPDLPFEDWDLLLRLAARAPVAHVPEALVDFRQHDASATRSRFSLMLEGRMQVLEKWLGRDPRHDEIILPYLRRQSWRLFKVHPDRARPHLALAHRHDRSVTGRLRHLVATRAWAERAFEGLRRASRPIRRRVRSRPA